MNKLNSVESISESAFANEPPDCYPHIKIVKVRPLTLHEVQEFPRIPKRIITPLVTLPKGFKHLLLSGSHRCAFGLRHHISFLQIHRVTISSCCDTQQLRGLMTASELYTGGLFA